MLGLVGALPVTIVVALGTRATVLDSAAPIAGFGICSGIWLFGYIRIRTFRCPRCRNYFTVRNWFDTNSPGRKCVHCGLDAYA